MFTVIYERPPDCITCRRSLSSWIMFGEVHRCPRCEDRARSVAVRRIFHDLRMEYIRQPKKGKAS